MKGSRRDAQPSAFADKRQTITTNGMISEVYSAGGESFGETWPRWMMPAHQGSCGMRFDALCISGCRRPSSHRDQAARNCFRKDLRRHASSAVVARGVRGRRRSKNVASASGTRQWVRAGEPKDPAHGVGKLVRSIAINPKRWRGALASAGRKRSLPSRKQGTGASSHSSADRMLDRATTRVRSRSGCGCRACLRQYFLAALQPSRWGWRIDPAPADESIVAEDERMMVDGANSRIETERMGRQRAHSNNFLTRLLREWSKNSGTSGLSRTQGNSQHDEGSGGTRM